MANTLVRLSRLIRQSLSGEHMDFTTGSIRRAVILLSVPMILEMCMESVFGIVDIFFVGRLGEKQVAAVALTESVLTIVYSLAVGLSMAATAMVARRIGEKDEAAANRAAAQAVLLALVLTVCISSIGTLLAAKLLEWMDASPQTIQVGIGYTRLVYEGSIVIM